MNLSLPFYSICLRDNVRLLRDFFLVTLFHFVKIIIGKKLCKNIYCGV